MNKAPQVERRKISDFQPDSENANKGTERGLRTLDDSLANVGLGRSIVVDKTGRIIGGNKTQERAIDRGFEDAIVIHSSGAELVVVQRDDLDLADPSPDNKARLMAYLDNRSAELDLSWDVDRLLADVERGIDLSGLWRQDELDELLKTIPDGFKEYDESTADDVEYVTCPHCGEKFPK